MAFHLTMMRLAFIPTYLHAIMEPDGGTNQKAKTRSTQDKQEFYP